MSSGSMKKISRNLSALSSFGFSIAHLCLSLSSAFFNILLQSSGHQCSSLDVACHFVSLLPDHMCPSGGFSLNGVNWVKPVQRIRQISWSIDIPIIIDAAFSHNRFCSSGSSPASAGFRSAPRGEHLSTRSRLFGESLSTDPSASRNTFSVSKITDGHARAGSRSSYLPLRGPDCTLSRLHAEECDRPATPEPSSRTISTLDRTLVARWSVECVTTPGSRRSCPRWAAAHFTWTLTVFTSLACCLGALAR